MGRPCHEAHDRPTVVPLRRPQRDACAEAPPVQQVKLPADAGVATT